MDALIFDSKNKKLSFTKTDPPKIVEKNEVIVRVVYAGVCGTDLHIIDGKFPCKDQPFIPGHEFCGVVSSVGTEVKHVKPGDRVVVDPNSGCGVCASCAIGQYHLCPGCGHSAIGIYKNGGWAQFSKALAHQVHLIPDTMSFQQAVLCEPLSCVSHAWDRLGPLTIGSTILVTGAGIIGNLWLSLLHLAGHRKVIVAEPRPTRRAFTQQLNTGYQCMSPEELQAFTATNPEWGADVCIDCTGKVPLIEQGISLLRPGGKLGIFGVASPETTVSISPFEIFKKELTIVGMLINPFSFQQSLALIETMGSRYLNFETLAVKMFSLDECQEALTSLKTGKISKAVFKVSPEVN